MFIKIDLKEEYIKNGKPGDCSECPIAIAINKKLRKNYRAVVYSYGISVFRSCEDDECLKIKFPANGKVRKFISDFDLEHTVHPFSFFIRVKKEYLGVFKRI